ncbi:MAG: DUF6265 family protein [Pseudomonadota bacterium]|nr:DUF6265 family protein [Pseudomonadota bacterium]
MSRSRHRLRIIVACVAAALAPLAADGQTPAPPTTQPTTPSATQPATPAATQSVAPATPPSVPPQTLEALAWLRGCWEGKVTRREFSEQWQSARGGMMLGSSQTVLGQRTEDYTYMRIESRPDGLYYVAVPSGKKEIAFKLTSIEDDKGVKVFTFNGAQDVFPQRIVYRRTEGGLMFAQVGGKVDGKDKEVTYPMHRVDCATGAPPRD